MIQVLKPERKDNSAVFVIQLSLLIACVSFSLVNRVQTLEVYVDLT